MSGKFNLNNTSPNKLTLEVESDNEISEIMEINEDMSEPEINEDMSNTSEPEINEDVLYNESNVDSLSTANYNVIDELIKKSERNNELKTQSSYNFTDGEIVEFDDITSSKPDLPINQDQSKSKKKITGGYSLIGGLNLLYVGLIISIIGLIIGVVIGAVNVWSGSLYWQILVGSSILFSVCVGWITYRFRD